MRAILILIHVCLLNQFIRVECAKKIPYPECGSVYTCLVPEKCIDGSTAILDSNVKKAEDTIYDDCPALFRYHAYNDYWVHVSIESFDATITSVLFISTIVGDTKATREFSCTFDGVKAKGEYRNAFNNKHNKVQASESKKLKCSFDVNLRNYDDVFHKSTSMRDAQFKIKNNQNQQVNTGESSFTIKKRCNPKNINFNKDETNPRRKYKKVTYALGEFSCDEPHLFKTEYRKDESFKYEPVSSLKCDSDKFKINGRKLPSDDLVEIRCFAEAKFLCNYMPMALYPVSAINEKMDFTPPNIDINQQSELKCPVSHPHLVADGLSKPILNPKFECLNHGSDFFWTVNDVAFTSNGRKVSCTNTVQCHRMQKISESIVKNGRLDGRGLPMCYDTGKLSVNGEDVTDQKCNTHTGKFQYVVEKADAYQDVIEETKFNCTYPQLQNVEQNEANKSTMRDVQIAIIASAAVFGIGSVIGVVCYASSRFKKRKQRFDEIKKIDDAAWNEHCMDENEKVEYANKAKDDAAPASAPCADPSKFSDPMMSLVLTALKQITLDNDLAESELLGSRIDGTIQELVQHPRIISFSINDLPSDTPKISERFAMVCNTMVKGM